MCACCKFCAVALCLLCLAPVSSHRQAGFVLQHGTRQSQGLHHRTNAGLPHEWAAKLASHRADTALSQRTLQ